MRLLSAILVPIAAALAAVMALFTLELLALSHYFSSEGVLSNLGRLLWTSQPFGNAVLGVTWAIVMAAAFWAGYRTAGVVSPRVAALLSGALVFALLTLVSLGSLFLARGPAELLELQEDANFNFLGKMLVLAVVSGGVGAWFRFMRLRAT